MFITNYQHNITKFVYILLAIFVKYQVSRCTVWKLIHTREWNNTKIANCCGYLPHSSLAYKYYTRVSLSCSPSVEDIQLLCVSRSMRALYDMIYVNVMYEIVWCTYCQLLSAWEILPSETSQCKAADEWFIDMHKTQIFCCEHENQVIGTEA